MFNNINCDEISIFLLQSVYFSNLVRKCVIHSFANFTGVQRVDVGERISEKQVFRVADTQTRAENRENGHEQEGFVRTEAPVAIRGEHYGLFLWFLAAFARCKLDRQEEEGWRAHGGVITAGRKSAEMSIKSSFSIDCLVSGDLICVQIDASFNFKGDISDGAFL